MFYNISFVDMVKPTKLNFTWKKELFACSTGYFECLIKSLNHFDYIIDLFKAKVKDRNSRLNKI